jgi:uncharacterized membrane protein
MKTSDALIVGAVASVLTLAAGAAQAQKANVHCAELERCYGISKAGKNDCATATSACAGTAKLDSQKDAWVYLPKGACEKLTGASPKSPVAAKK